MLPQINYLAIPTTSLIFRPIHYVDVDRRFLWVRQKLHHRIVDLFAICSRYAVVHIVERLSINESVLDTGWGPYAEVGLVFNHLENGLADCVAVVVDDLKVG